MSKVFNAQQQQAIEAPLGQTLVIAGAGSGKTSVLTHRIAYVVQHFHLYPSQILGITFTNKAANEMKERLKTLVSDQFRWIGTFHGICLRILREDITVLNQDSNFTILDEDDQIAIIKEFVTKHDLFDKDSTISSTNFYRICLNHIAKFKEEQWTLDDFRDEKKWKSLGLKNLKQAVTHERIIRHYLDYCQQHNYLDFNDLLHYTLKVLANPEAREKWQNKFQYILVDEFQDTNDIQYELIRILAAKHRHVFAVGDPDQMIYSWRGANENIFKRFAYDFTDTQTIILNQNYRSTQAILDASNNLIKNNLNRIHKDLFSHMSGNKPIYYEADSQEDEAVWVANRIAELQTQGYCLNDILVLYRSNYLSRTIEETFFANNIHYVLYGGTKFYNRKEIKDIIAYLKTIYFHDELSTKRIINLPRRGISQQTIDVIDTFANEQQCDFFTALSRVEETHLNATAKNAIKRFLKLIDDCYEMDILKTFDNILITAGYQEYLETSEQTDRLKNIEELKNSIIQYQKNNPQNNFQDYLQEVSLLASADEEKQEDAVHLMTIHIAKGLEFKCVFLVGLNEDIFPSKKSKELGLKGIEEERRVAYVAITRAQEKLFLSSFRGFNYINHTPHLPSRFIDEISSMFYERAALQFKKVHHADNEQWFDSKQTFDASKQYHHEAVHFKIGDKVSHKIFGFGIVVGVHGENIDVNFNKPHGLKTLIANHTSIQRVVS